MLKCKRPRLLRVQKSSYENCSISGGREGEGEGGEGAVGGEGGLGSVRRVCRGWEGDGAVDGLSGQDSGLWIGLESKGVMSTEDDGMVMLGLGLGGSGAEESVLDLSLADCLEPLLLVLGKVRLDRGPREGVRVDLVLGPRGPGTGGLDPLKTVGEGGGQGRVGRVRGGQGYGCVVRAGEMGGQRAKRWQGGIDELGARGLCGQGSSSRSQSSRPPQT